MNNFPFYFLPKQSLQDLIDALQSADYHCIGPQVRDGAIVYDALTEANQLPWGMRDYQAPGEYRLEKIPEQEAFAWANGPQAIKPLLFKPVETVWKVTRNEQGKMQFLPIQPEEPPMAVIGARACDLAAMAIQDKVFIHSQYVDIRYKKRRDALFAVAVNCTYLSNNCFCVSAGTGPEATHSYDLLMNELSEGFIITAGSENGSQLLTCLNLAAATEEQCAQAKQRVQNAAKTQTKQIPFNNSRALRDLLFANLEHPRWSEVADRCLSCGNCTAVCPTCFCHHESNQPTLDGTQCEQEKQWDSCFTEGHSYMGGQVIRDDTRKRYRQWLTHKVGSWFDQFGTSGCVGCGRCISWCPVGIDITEELAAIKTSRLLT